MTAIYRFGRFELRPSTRQVFVDNQPAPLGARAFDLLLALIERRERLVTKNELLDLVWPALVVEENNLQVQVSALRKLLGQDAIATVAGRGYRFAVAELVTQLEGIPLALELAAARVRATNVTDINARQLTTPCAWRCRSRARSQIQIATDPMRENSRQT